MEANELRIGNYATDSIQTGAITVFNNDACVLKHKSGIVKCRISDLSPVPLTEEWLFKFGFIRHHRDYSNGIIYIKNVPDNTKFEWGVYPNKLGSGIQIKNRILLHSVHQLQNLYFALTGEELTFKSE